MAGTVEEGEWAALVALDVQVEVDGLDLSQILLGMVLVVAMGRGLKKLDKGR